MAGVAGLGREEWCEMKYADHLLTNILIEYTGERSREDHRSKSVIRLGAESQYRAALYPGRRECCRGFDASMATPADRVQSLGQRTWRFWPCVLGQAGGRPQSQRRRKSESAQQASAKVCRRGGAELDVFGVVRMRDLLDICTMRVSRYLHCPQYEALYQDGMPQLFE